MSRTFSIVASVLLTALVLPATQGADPAGAERQYRVARRLAAEGSPEAAEALRKVVELDPEGDLADDALVDQALLEELPRWPEELGLLGEEEAIRALGLLGRAADGLPGADRAAEARYYRALVRLEPLPSHDLSGARIDLIGVATGAESAEWRQVARYAGAWFAAELGRLDRAQSAYHRLLVDAPGSAAADRARVALARLLLRDGHYGRAAGLLQTAAAGEAGAPDPARALREIAVRRVIEGGTVSFGVAETASTGIRKAAGLVAAGDGVLIGDTRSGMVVLFRSDGTTETRWTLEELQALTADTHGRIFAAAGDHLFRLLPDRPAVRLASQGDFAPVTALTVDAVGRLWVLDRRGERIGRIAPGGGGPTEIWQSRESQLVSLVWDGRRLVAADAKGKGVLTVDAEGAEAQLLAAGQIQKPGGATVDPTGRIGVIDAKGGVLVILDRQGQTVSRLEYRPLGLQRPAALAFSTAGSLNVFDESSGVWMRLP